MFILPNMASYFILLLLSLNAFSVVADFVSIDCGTSDFYTENSISWEGDNGLIQNGVPVAIKTNNPLLSRTMSTLRVFTTRLKNCYSIEVNKGQIYLVRASFYYGNYDNKSTPPIFNLQFDGNPWTTVATAIDTPVFTEAIVAAKKSTISVCVAQILRGMFPFISALEVRSLPSNIYPDVDSDIYALILRRRVAFGAKEIVRYPDDEYDRIWLPAINLGGFTVATSNATLAVNLADNPPAAVLQNAFIATNTSSLIALRTNLPLTEEIPIYMNMYFSEITQLDSTQQRSFLFYVNGVPVTKPITPHYGNVTELSFTNFSASANTSFVLGATSNSTLPPLINALEVFSISDKLTDGTSSDDVDGLAVMQEKFDVLREWRGDPCLPSPFTWDWVNCTIDFTPRVTALYLSGYGLSGSLPDFSSMVALETIDLHNNSLNGPIPDFFGTLPNLKLLNLADNDFSGPVPSSLSKNTKLKLVVTGNPNLCSSGKSCQTTNTTNDPESGSGNSSGDSPESSSSSSKKKNKLPIILGATISSVVILFAIVGALTILHHQRKSAAVAANRTAGQIHAGNGLNGTAQQMMGKVALASMNEFKVNINEQTTMEAENEMDHNQVHEGHHGANNN